MTVHDTLDDVRRLFDERVLDDVVRAVEPLVRVRRRIATRRSVISTGRLVAA